MTFPNILKRNVRAKGLKDNTAKPHAVLRENTRFDSFLFFIPLTGIFAAWEVLGRTGVIGIQSIPLPSAIFQSLLINLGNTSFVHRVALSFVNLMGGIVIAFFFAIPIAVFSGLKQKFDSTFTPLIMLGGALPDLALLPLFVYWFGPGGLAAIFMATIASFFPLYFTVRGGVRDIPKEYFHVARIYRTSSFDVYRKVVLPAVSPQIITGARLAFDFVWEIVLAIEIFAQVQGIGSFINLSVSSGSITDAFAAIFSIGILAIVIDRIMFHVLETRIGRWSE